MTAVTTLVLVGARLAVLLLGVTITYYSVAAYRRTGAGTPWQIPASQLVPTPC